MFRIKNYHFLLIFIFVNIFSSLLKKIFQVPISDILLIFMYFVYTLIIIQKLNKIVKSLNKYYILLLYFSHLYLFYGIFYGLYLQLFLGEFEYFKYIENFNETILGSMMNIILYSNIFFTIPFLLTKALISCEKKEVVKVFSYPTDFLKFIIPPIAIWLMVPRINKVYEDTLNLEENDELE